MTSLPDPSRASGRDHVPDSVGPYRVLQVLGEGGMGVVYLAEQSAPLERQVAVKVIKSGMDTRRVVERFEAERRALAVMEHPGIATIFDAGVTQDGRPYFVMEVVRGQQLLEYCDHRRMTVAERIELFLDVCSAVQHAHQKGVVHRDLKPSNIMVAQTDDGPRPKVIDFGIAKAMERPDEERLTADLDQVLGTPAYMSPEQAGTEASDVDTRADVYSLGILLYELVAGVLPFDRTAYRGWAALAAVLLRDPPLPSRRLATLGETQVTIAHLRRSEVGALTRQLKGDIDWIVLRAIERDRERRYGTVAELAADLRRYLALEPVVARPPSRRYRLAKFVRRNPAGVGLGSILGVSLVAFGITQAVLRARVAEARDDAVVARDDAVRVLDFMIGDLYEQLEPIGQLPVLLSVGLAATEYFASRPVEEFGDEELGIRSKALYQLGQVQLGQGHLPEAQETFDESLRLSAALSERDPGDSERLYERGQSEFWAGELARRRGDTARTAAHFQRYRDISVELVARDPTPTAWLQELGYSHTNMGVVLRGRGDSGGALREFQAALDVKRRAAGDSPSQGQRLDLAAALGWISLTQRDLAALKDARATLREQLAMYAEMEGADSIPRIAFAYGVAMLRAAELEWDLGDVAASRDLARRHRRLAATLASRDPTNTVWRRELANATLWSARAAHALGDVEAAEADVLAATDALSALVSGSPEVVILRRLLAHAECRRAEILVSLGRFDEADDAVDRARELLSPAPEDADTRSLMAEVLLTGAEIRARSGRPDEARAQGVEALRLARAAYSPGRYSTRVGLARALAWAGSGQEAHEVAAPLLAAGAADPQLLQALSGVSG